MSNDLVGQLKVVSYECEEQHGPERWSKVTRAAVAHIERLEAALRMIDSMIPKNDPTIPAICLVAGDVAEGALNGTWPAFGVTPLSARQKKRASACSSSSPNTMCKDCDCWKRTREYCG